MLCLPQHQGWGSAPIQRRVRFSFCGGKLVCHTVCVLSLLRCFAQPNPGSTESVCPDRCVVAYSCSVTNVCRWVPAHSVSIVTLAGYTKADTLSFWGSPFSPTNRMKGALLGAVLSSKVRHLVTAVAKRPPSNRACTDPAGFGRTGFS